MVRSTSFLRLWIVLSKPAGRPPLLPLPWRLARWFLGSGMVCLIWRRRRQRRLRREEYALSPPRWSGRVRGCPPPRRPTRMRSMTGMSCGASPHWPGVISRARGGVHPHRRGGSCRSDRPGSVRVPRRGGAAGACVFSRYSWQFPTSPGGVLMGPAGGRIDAHHRPVDPAFRVGVGQDGRKDTVPGAVRRPASVPFVHRLPWTETRR